MSGYHNNIDHRPQTIDHRRRALPFGTGSSVFCLLSSVFCLLSVVSCLLSAGCGGNHQQAAQTEPICLANVQKFQAMQITEDVLAKMHFTVDKADAERGLITTRPLAGAQFFEFWRSDNVGAFNSAEANMHSIRRTVALNISLPAGPQGKKLCIDCEVRVQRLSLPERQISSSTRAYELFSQSTSSMQSLKLNPEQKTAMAWVDLGNDKRLAAEILKRIKERIGNW